MFLDGVGKRELFSVAHACSGFFAGLDGERLEALKTKGGTRTSSSCCTTSSGQGRSDANAVLTRRTDGKAFSKFVQRLFNLPGRLADEVVGRMERGRAVVDFEANPRLAGSGDEQAVPPRFSQVMTDVSADVGVDVALGQWGTGHHHSAP